MKCKQTKMAMSRLWEASSTQKSTVVFDVCQTHITKNYVIFDRTFLTCQSIWHVKIFFMWLFWLVLNIKNKRVKKYMPFSDMSKNFNMSFSNTSKNFNVSKLARQKIQFFFTCLYCHVKIFLTLHYCHVNKNADNFFCF